MSGSAAEVVAVGTPEVRQPDSLMIPAVILAAGEGSRLRDANDGLPKPLTLVAGQTLLQRAVLSCRAAGVRQVYVVTGCDEAAVAACVEQMRPELDISLRAIFCPQWREGNGSSALAAQAYVSGPFLLLMCDHLFDPEILRRLASEAVGDECLLAVDRHIGTVFDLKDASKVRLDGPVITAIGKSLSPFDAVDTGLFLCRPELFRALEAVRRDGAGSLSRGVRRLIKARQARAVEVSGRFWLDVDDSASLAHAERLLAST